MQNKGLIKFFAILFALVSIYQLSFTFVASKVKNDAKSFAGGNPEKEVKYLDSIGKENVFNLGFTNFTFNEVSDKQINKGLDLEGGINVILQISVKDVLKGLSNNSKNPVSINPWPMLLQTKKEIKTISMHFSRLLTRILKEP